MSFQLDDSWCRGGVGMATIEEVKEDVMQVFEAQQGIKARTAWPIGLWAWQVEGEDGQVYTLRW